MGKILVEVCIISARGLRRSSSLLKQQWYAVGWIDPNNKYCTNIDVSRNDNPVWRTKFATLLDESSLQDSTALHVEVKSREPIFLRERLHGTAIVVLKEFLAKYRHSSSRSGAEEAGSYQLRKRNSNKPQGFVDVSIRISRETEELSSYPGIDEGFVLTNNTGAKLSTEGGNSGQIHLSNTTQHHFTPAHQPANHSTMNPPYNPRPVPYPPNYTNPSMPGPSQRPPNTTPPPPPPPPSNTGYIPTFIPRSETYVNVPSSSGRGGPGPGFATGLGAGALAAGAVIFGDDFMSGFDVPSSLPAASLTISIDPPF